MRRSVFQFFNFKITNWMLRAEQHSTRLLGTMQDSNDENSQPSNTSNSSSSSPRPPEAAELPPAGQHAGWPPYDRNYSGERNAAPDSPWDWRHGSDVFYNMRMPAAADTRLRQLEAASSGTMDSGQVLHKHTITAQVLHRVIAIGLSAIDMYERRATEFVRQQAMEAEQAARDLAAWTGAFVMPAIQCPPGRPPAGAADAFYRPTDAPIGPSEKPISEEPAEKEPLISNAGGTRHIFKQPGPWALPDCRVRVDGNLAYDFCRTHRRIVFECAKIRWRCWQDDAHRKAEQRDDGVTDAARFDAVERCVTQLTAKLDAIRQLVLDLAEQLR